MPNDFLAFLPGPLPIKLALLALPMLPNLWGIWHAHRHRFDGQKQIIWMAVCVLVPVIGGLAYIFAGRKQAMKPAEAQRRVSGE